MPIEAITPLYFGPPGRQLFGFHHSPGIPAGRRTGVVLCYPHGHEYIQFHRCMAHLGVLLSRAGFSVLRFDFFGCGDSAGSCEEARLEHWIGDVLTATEELKRREPRIETVCLVGLRLGASLALMAAGERVDVDQIVLLDPIVNGRVHRAELFALHRDVMRYAHVQTNGDEMSDDSREILGFPFTEELSRGLEELDLLEMRQKPANRALVIQSDPKTDPARLSEHLEHLGVQVDRACLPCPEIWVWEEDFGKLLVPFKVLQAAVNWISGS